MRKNQADIFKDMWDTNFGDGGRVFSRFCAGRYN